MRAPSAGTLLFLTASIALAQGTIPDLTDTPITFSGHADDFVAGPDGNVWLVNSISNAIGRLAVDGSAYQAFPVPTAASGINSIAVGSDGNLWFTESSASKVGRITTAGAITEFALPPDFHFPQYSFVGTSGTIAAGPDANLWISGIGQMAKVTPQGSVTVVTVPPPAGIRLVEIGKCVAGPDGNLWCLSAAEIQGSDYRVAKLTTAGGVTLYPATEQEFDIVEAPDGNVWISAGSVSPDCSLTRVTPAGVETVYALPTKRESRLAVGADGNIWFTERTTMGNLWQLVLSSATDDGHAEFNSAPIGLGYPEQIVTVMSPAGASGIHPEEPAAGCPAYSWVLGSPASYGPNLRWVKKKSPPECTDLVADVDVLRYRLIDASGVANCYDDFDSHDDAKTAVLSIRLPTGSEVSTHISSGPFFADGTCTGTGPNIHCDAPLIKRDFDFEVKFEGNIEGGNIHISCSSATAEEDDSDNEDDTEETIGLGPIQISPPVDLRTRWFYGQVPN